jgi:hypothetical protein
VNPIVKPLNSKLAQHNKFSNASFTTNFSANKTRTFSSKGRFGWNTTTMVTKPERVALPLSTTYLLNSVVIEKTNQDNLVNAKIQNVTDLQDLKQSVPRTRIRTAVTRNQTQLRQSALRSALFHNNDIYSTTLISD